MRERYRYSSRHLKIPGKKPQPNRAPVFFAIAIPVAVALVVVLTLVFGPFHGSSTPAKQLPFGDAATVQATTAATFDVNKDAPLPTNRILAAYGIIGGPDYTGPASNTDTLTNFLPQMQQLSQQFTTLDPTHPVKLGIDLVVNVFQPCSYQYCRSLADDPTIQSYVDYCQKNNLLLFLDLQLGTEPVPVAVGEVEKWLTKYPFVELEIDTEFHFPNTPTGQQLAAEYARGSVDASDINWAINEMAKISLQNHLPRKVLVADQFFDGAITNKGNIKTNPNVSFVIQEDGTHDVQGKIAEYDSFIRQQFFPYEYGGYKQFFYYADNPLNNSPYPTFDSPQETPASIMQLFPQPLYISYQ